MPARTGGNPVAAWTERDILSLQQAENGVLFAGTNHGIFQSGIAKRVVAADEDDLGTGAGVAAEAGRRPRPVAVRSRKSSKAAAATKRKTVPSKTKVPPEPVIPLADAPRVRSLQMGDKAWFAATDDGLFISVDQGQKWYGQPVEGEREFSVVNCYEDGTVTLAGLKGAYLSRDDGKTWTRWRFRST